MGEVVLIKDREFIYPVDFVALKTEVVVSPENEIPVIFGRPFLATCNALINCKDGKMKLTFRNMTMEVNVFSFHKQPMGFNGVEHSTLHWVEDFSYGELEFNHDELESCLYESFCMEYEPEFDTLAFDEQCDDSLCASLLKSLTSLPVSFHEALPSIRSSSSLE